MTRHWISTESFTVMVQTEGGKIVWTAPLVKKFIGQPIGNLLRWAIPFGGFRHESLPMNTADGSPGEPAG